MSAGVKGAAGVSPLEIPLEIYLGSLYNTQIRANIFTKYTI